MWRFLLADVFEKFRNNSSKILWIIQGSRLYLSATGLRWDEMLKMTKIKLERIIDADMYIFFDTRGEISYISNRYSKASNKYWNLITKNKNQNILCT